MKSTSHRIVIALATLASVTLSTSAALAATATPTQTTAAHVAAIQAKGATDISTRLASLTTWQSKVSAAKRLTAAQKADITTDLTTQSTELTTLKGTLSSETDVTTAKTDFQNIFQQHYIYAFFLPRTQQVVVADGLSDASTNLAALIPKLQTFITQAQAQGLAVTTLQSTLADLQAKTTAVNTITTTAISTLVALKATDYPGNKTSMQSTEATLKTARADLKVARTDAQTLVTGLKKLLVTSTATPSTK